MPDFRVFLFGAPRLEHQQEPVIVDTRKALALIAYLLIEGQPQSRDTLAALFWPESDQASARAALRRTLSTLRNSLKADLLDFGREVIALQPGHDLWCDVIAFRSMLAGCRTHGHGEDQICPNCLIPLQEAANLYSTDFMSGFSLRDSVGFDDWQFFESDRLRRELAGVLERLVIIQQGQGDFTAALDYAHRWLSLDSLNEAAHRALIFLYAQSGQRNAALRQYRECVRILDEELGVRPLAETTQLYEAVKENRLEKLVVREPLTVISHLSDSETERRITDPRSLTSDHFPLIGRASEWEQLTRLYEELPKHGAFAALTGEAGIGKTHLAREFIAYAQNRGAVALSAQCYTGESNLAYTPLIDLLRQGLYRAHSDWWQGLHPRWLSEVTLLLPELSTIIPDLAPPQPTEGPGAQPQFFEGVCQILSALIRGPSPGIIFIDNLEWADESTQDLLAYLARRLQGRSIFLLVSWQTENPSVTIKLEQMLHAAELQGYGLTLPLTALQPGQSLALIEQLEKEDQAFSSVFKQQLIEASQGLPYFLVEYLQAALEGEIRSEVAANQWPVPAGLRGMLQARLTSLGGPASQILQAAAVIGRTFENDLLQSTSGRTEEEVIQGLEELLARNLIQEVPVQTAPGLSSIRYDFKQEQVRALVLAETSQVRRRLLHRRIAEALIEQSRFASQRYQYGQIAYHYQQAGLAEKAAEYYFSAGGMARAVHANADALVHFQASLALGYPQKHEVLVEMGDLYALNGDYPQAIQQYEAAAAFSSPADLPAIEQKIGRVYLRRGYWEQAACHFEAALYDLKALAPEQQKAFEAEVRVDWSLALHREGKTEQALTLAHAALTSAEISGDLRALAQVHNLLGVLARAENRPELALEHLTESLSLARRLDTPNAQIAALNNLALALADQNEFEQAMAMLENALEACQTLGDRHLEAALRNNLADLLRANGQENSAHIQLKQAVAIFAEIGQNVENWEPEIWKLTVW